MAYARDGAGGGRADYPNRLAALDWVFGRYQKIRFSFPRHINLGPSRGAIRRVAVHLRNTRFFSNRFIDRGALEHRNSSVSDRACSALDSPAARVFDRNVGGDSECHPRTLGHFRDDSLAARLSVSVPQAILRLDSVLQRADLRAKHARWWNYYRDHDFADYYFGLARDSPERSELTARSGVRAWRDPLGSDPDRSAELRQKRIIRRRHSRSRTRAGRNDGCHDGDRQHAADRCVAIQARIHAGQCAGQ